MDPQWESWRKWSEVARLEGEIQRAQDERDERERLRTDPTVISLVERGYSESRAVGNVYAKRRQAQRFRMNRKAAVRASEPPNPDDLPF